MNILDKWYVNKCGNVTQLIHQHITLQEHTFIPDNPLTWGQPQNKLINGKWLCFKSKTGKWRCIICGETAPDDICLMADLCFCERGKDVQLVIEEG